MSPRQRDGLRGLLTTSGDNARTGIWRCYDRQEQEADLDRVHFGGSLPARGIFAFEDYVRGSGAADGRDSHLGSVGGGNHFVEIQAVEEVLDGATAHAWGIRPGSVAIMAHSGSVGLGAAVGDTFAERAHDLFPRGSPSYLMAGSGNGEALASACHGAGRALARGKARQVDAPTYERAVARLRVVTPIDPEAPVIETVAAAGIARPVARLEPLLTVKG